MGRRGCRRAPRDASLHGRGGFAGLAIMKITSAVFEKSAPTLAGCPRWNLPEFAFIGRSNVGKSSLVNLLAHQRDLAKASDTPGKTKLINFFRFNTNWCLVDLPGYGFAKVAQGERADFNEAVADFLEQRENLVRVFVLIDSRLPPQRIDLEFLRWLAGTNVPFAFVFTKVDKQSASATQANVAVFKEAVAEFLHEIPRCFFTSATSRKGRDELLRFIGEELASARKE